MHHSCVGGLHVDQALSNQSVHQLQVPHCVGSSRANPFIRQVQYRLTALAHARTHARDGARPFYLLTFGTVSHLDTIQSPISLLA